MVLPTQSLQSSCRENKLEILKATNNTSSIGYSLVVQWLGLGAFTARAWVRSLVRELSSYKPKGEAKKKKKKQQQHRNKFPKFPKVWYRHPTRAHACLSISQVLLSDLTSWTIIGSYFPMSDEDLFSPSQTEWIISKSELQIQASVPLLRFHNPLISP